MACIINADNGAISGSAGVKTTADSTGVLNIQTNGTTAISISASQAVSFTNTPTFTGGTANGVLYLNGSKVATSGTALVFDGTNLSGTGSIGTTIAGKTAQFDAAGGSIYASFADGTKTWRFGAGIQSAGTVSLYNATDAVTAFTVNATGNLGIGTTSPGTKLDVVGTIQSNGVFSVNGTTTGDAAKVWFGSDGSGGGFINVPTSKGLAVYQNNATNLLTLNSSGNLGLGVTPSAWSSFKGLQVGDVGAVASADFGGSNVQAFLGNNVYYGSGGFNYIKTNVAAMYRMVGGAHQWNTAVSGTANTVISFTQAMTLDASGNLGIGTSSPSSRLDLQAASGETKIILRTVGNTADSSNYIAAETGGFTGDWANLGVGARHAIKFYNNGTERMRLDSSGNLGINNTSPSSIGKFVIQVDGTTTPTNGSNVGPSSVNLYAAGNGGSTNCTIGIFGWQAGNAGIGSGIGFTRESSADWGTQIRFYTHPTTTTNIGDITERARIDSSGNFLIGNTSGVGRLYVETSATPAVVFRNTDAASYTSLRLYNDINLANRALEIDYFGSTYSGGERAEITTTGAYPLCFLTSNAERARITSGGDLCVGTTAAISVYGLIHVRGDNKGIAIQDSTDNSYRAIYNQSGTLYFYNGTNEGYLSTAGAWVDASDVRLKENIVPIKHGLDSVMKSQPRSYKMKDGNAEYVGFIAQEMLDVIPECVSGKPEKQLGISYGSLVAVAFKAIQEQQAMIMALKAELEQLKGVH
jgi:hypothetical protein